MRLRARVASLIEGLTGVRVFRVLPRGLNLYYDIDRALPHFRATAIFDVGANVGQSAATYRTRFPQARIYCFEPVGATFAELQENVRADAGILCFRMALGSAKGRAEIAVQQASKLSSMAEVSPSTMAAGRREAIEVTTLDDFCQAAGVDQIGLLKVDTEGSDLEVLKGAQGMLEHHRIDLVQVEAGMNAGNRRHVPFDVLKGHLESLGYLLFGIYDQVQEFPTGEPHLRRSNPVFISRRLVEMRRSRRKA